MSDNITDVTGESAGTFTALFSPTLHHLLSRLLINKSQITRSEKVSKHVDQNFSPVQSREDF